MMFRLCMLNLPGTVVDDTDRYSPEVQDVDTGTPCLVPPEPTDYVYGDDPVYPYQPLGPYTPG